MSRPCLGPILLLALASGCAQPQIAPKPAPTTTRPTEEPRTINYAPHVRIDFRIPQVEVACEVILRQADLELFAYARAPVPKEHESILITDARPRAVFEALGLIGLTPGQPPRYDPDTQTAHPATGDEVDVLIRYEQDGKTVEHSACDWMLDAASKTPMKKSHWRFAGSSTMEDGTYFADYEGTIVTVVDFDSSLLALPTSHTSADAQLWLKARTDAIPPVGTKVTLILRPHKHAD